MSGRREATRRNSVALVGSLNVERLRAGLAGIARSELDFVDLAAEVTDLLVRTVPFDRSCWHTVDPGTVLFTGSVNFDVACSGRWLAEYEYEVDDVNQWRTLARSGELVGRTSEATSGDLQRCARYRSTRSHGIGDELRASFVADGIYWGAAGLLRDEDRPWFTDEEEHIVKAVVDVLAGACRRALVHSAGASADAPAVDGPGLIVLNDNGGAEMVTPAAARWVEEMLEEPPPHTTVESKVVQSVAAQAWARGPGGDPLAMPSRARVRTRSGGWLVVYATPLGSSPSTRTAIVIQPAMPGEVAPVVALSYGLTSRESDVARLCLQGQSTKEMAAALRVTPYTVQDHLKSIFEKTGTRTRNELVGRVFLTHYVTRWEEVADAPTGWIANAVPEAVRR